MTTETTATTETRLHQPGVPMFLGVGGLFTVVGIGMAFFASDTLANVPEGVDLFSKAGFDRHGAAVVLPVMAGLFGGMGLLVFCLGLRWLLAPAFVRHAPDNAAPDVPRKPLLPDDAATHSHVTHHLTAGAFAPNPAARRKIRIFLFGFASVFGAAMMALLLGVRPLDDLAGADSTVLHAMFGVFGWIMIFIVAFVIDYVQRRSIEQLAVLEFDGDGWSITVEDETAAHGERDQLAAVQVVAARHKIRNQGSTTITDALEVNLAWRDGDTVERHNLLRCNGNFAGATRIAGELAQELGVPLLFHGSKDHWSREKGRSRRRRAGRGSIGT